MTLIKRVSMPGKASAAAWPWRSGLVDAACAVLSICACAVIGWYGMGFHVLRPDAPSLYLGDALQYQYIYQFVREDGLFGTISRAGAPFVTTHFDFPNADAFNLLCIKLLGLVWDDPFVLYKAFIHLSFVLCSLSSFLVFRRLGIEPAFALAASVAFTVIPFHFMRQGHLFYLMYFSAALAAWLALAVTDEDPPHGTRLRRYFVAVVAALLCGSSGVYFAFFSCLVVFTGGIVAALRAGTWRPLMRGTAVTLVIVSTTMVQLVPSMLHSRDEGPNLEVAQRQPFESEVYGLKLSSMVLPRGGHQSEVLAKIRQDYDSTAPLVNENSTSALGMIGALGLLILLAAPFLGVLARQLPDVTRRASGPAYALLLFTTIGGFGSLFAYLVSPQLRALNRASPFISFLAVLAAIGVLQLVVARLFRDGPARVAAVLAASTGVAMVSVLDQTNLYPRSETSSWAAYYENATRSFDSDRAFFLKLERALPRHSMIWQIPFVTYPESAPPTRAFGSYDFFKAYLHTRTLRWSFGAMRGRPESSWQVMLDSFPFAERVRVLHAVGFAGLYIDWNGVVDQATLSKSLADAQLQAAFDSDDRSKSFYGLPTITRPAFPVAPLRGWFAFENDAAGIAMWSKGSASVVVGNVEHAPRSCTLDLVVSTLDDGRTIEVWVDGEMLSRVTPAPGTPTRLSATVPAFEGTQTIELRTNKPAVSPGNGDPRMLGFRVQMVSMPLCAQL